MSINSENFSLLSKLPQYVFSSVNELKYQARSRGEDIIDFGMGNPDQPTPRHIIEKLLESSLQGKVLEILVENEQAVEFGQPLMLIG